MENIENYKNTIKQYAESQTDYNFQTIGKDYALVVLERIILSARRIVKYTSESFYGDEVEKDMSFIEALCSFLSQPDTQLQIIVSNVPEDSNVKDSLNPYFRLYQTPAYREGRITIKNAKGCHFMNNARRVDFCVADTVMYRYESDTDKSIASCNFNDSEFSNKIEGAFDAAFKVVPESVDLSNLFA